MERYSVTRVIGIDAGHRVMTHGSKCRNLHGHRYQIEATCSAREAQLHAVGEQTDMVIDFGFLKDEMMAHIDAPCDHGLILSIQDIELLRMFAPESYDFDDWHARMKAEIATRGYADTINAKLDSKLYIMQHQPTAECLAEHWFNRLAPAVAERSDGVAELTRIRVWETPNCYAEYWAES